ncbi:MAG: DUF2851 family protein [Nitrospinae bacterium]|nr:DUF2851 family protein [Nitrospinota bacterium]
MFSRLYLDLASETPITVRENDKPTLAPPAKSGRVNEDVVKAIWLEQPWGANPVRDVKGRRVEILSPGWLNGGAGPDFRNAIYKVDGGPLVKGDVEIHVRSSDWARHGHHKDPAYDAVGLHVVLYSDAKGVEKLARSAFPALEIELAPVCSAAIDRIRTQTPLDPSHVNFALITGKCAAVFKELGEDKAMTLLDAAGEGRCDLKSRRYTEAMKRGDGARELYAGIMESLGYSAFKAQFARLAAAVPVERLKETLDGVPWRSRRIMLQGVLFGVAGLLPDASILKLEPEDETAGYVAKLREAWSHVSGKFDFKPEISPGEWRLAGTRPANYPIGRIAGIACFLSAHIDDDMETLFLRALDGMGDGGGGGSAKRGIEKVETLFETPPEEYMATHYTIGGKKLSRPRSLIGTDRVTAMMINVIIPYMLARARRIKSAAEEETIRRIYHAIPPGQSNCVVGFMADRLSSAFSKKELICKTPRQQGLIQIYADYCTANGKGCEDCGFLKYIGKLG